MPDRKIIHYRSEFSTEFVIFGDALPGGQAQSLRLRVSGFSCEDGAAMLKDIIITADKQHPGDSRTVSIEPSVFIRMPQGLILAAESIPKILEAIHSHAPRIPNQVLQAIGQEPSDIRNIDGCANPKPLHPTRTMTNISKTIKEEAKAMPTERVLSDDT